MDLAEERMREAGYHGFSFRELAAKIGIKSASVHHHFPTKADMAAAVARRYLERFLENVAPQPGESGEDVIAVYRSAFRRSIEHDGGMCLSGMLGAESGGLPVEVAEEIENFFRKAVEDLAQRLGGSEERAFAVLATLEGALILARAYGEVAAFDHAAAALTDNDAPPLMPLALLNRKPHAAEKLRA
nr:TetR/AcrR family transcriptional regulator [Sphingomonas oligoaromativorans]